MCTKLTLSDLNQMVGAVQKSCPSAVRSCGQKEVEVDVDELDMKAFVAISALVGNKGKVKTETSL
jgi:hypothetical protein